MVGSVLRDRILLSGVQGFGFVSGFVLEVGFGVCSHTCHFSFKWTTQYFQSILSCISWFSFMQLWIQYVKSSMRDNQLKSLWYIGLGYGPIHLIYHCLLFLYLWYLVSAIKSHFPFLKKNKSQSHFTTSRTSFQRALF